MEEAQVGQVSDAVQKTDPNRWATPGLPSPPITKTPPTAERPSSFDVAPQAAGTERASTPLDAQALSAALKGVETGSTRQREVTPGASPTRKRQRVYGDR